MMEWLQQNTLLGDEDLRIFRFKSGHCRIFELQRQNTQSGSRSTILNSEEDWKTWLREAASTNPNKKENGLVILFAERAATKMHDGMSVSHLPIPRPIFGSIINTFNIHGSISRVINRNTSAVFAAQFVRDTTTREVRLVYNCRSSASWPDDLATSVTYFPETHFTQAVIYGCSEARIERITRRLESSDGPIFHPLTLPTLFAEIERDRQMQMVDKVLNRLITKVLNVVNNPLRCYDTAPRDKSGISHGSDNADSMRLWLDISHMKNGLQSWKQQLLEMLAHSHELSDMCICDGIDHVDKPTPAKHGAVENAVQQSEQATRNKLMNEIGERIKQRIHEIISEYDEKIRACATIMDGMTLATQMEWSKIGQLDAKTTIDISNSALDIAKAARRDGRQMRSIAMLTMIFLPATFVATLFSMSFFNWNQDAGKTTVSPYIWVYVVSTLLLTAITTGTWYVCTRIRVVDKPRRDENSA